MGDPIGVTRSRTYARWTDSSLQSSLGLAAHRLRWPPTRNPEERLKKMEAKVRRLRRTVRDRMRSVRRRMIGIAHTLRVKGPAGKEKCEEHYQPLLQLTRQMLSDTRRVLAEVKQLPGWKKKVLFWGPATMAVNARGVVVRGDGLDWRWVRLLLVARAPAWDLRWSRRLGGRRRASSARVEFTVAEGGLGLRRKRCRPGAKANATCLTVARTNKIVCPYAARPIR